MLGWTHNHSDDDDDDDDDADEDDDDDEDGACQKTIPGPIIDDEGGLEVGAVVVG